MTHSSYVPEMTGQIITFMEPAMTKKAKKAGTRLVNRKWDKGKRQSAVAGGRTFMSIFKEARRKKG